MSHAIRIIRGPRALGLVIAGLLASGALFADAPIYQWRDAGGVVHYGDTPPAAARSLRLRQTAGAVPARAGDGSEAPAFDAAACERKREQLKGYRLADKVTETNALGDVREYSDAERQALIAGTEAQVRAACGEPPATN